MAKKPGTNRKSIDEIRYEVTHRLLKVEALLALFVGGSVLAWLLFFTTETAFPQHYALILASMAAVAVVGVMELLFSPKAMGQWLIAHLVILLFFTGAFFILMVAYYTQWLAPAAVRYLFPAAGLAFAFEALIQLIRFLELIKE